MNLVIIVFICLNLIYSSKAQSIGVNLSPECGIRHSTLKEKLQSYMNNGIDSCCEYLMDRYYFIIFGMIFSQGENCSNDMKTTMKNLDHQCERHAMTSGDCNTNNHGIRIMIMRRIKISDKPQEWKQNQMEYHRIKENNERAHISNDRWYWITLSVMMLIGITLLTIIYVIFNRLTRDEDKPPIKQISNGKQKCIPNHYISI
jgi:hypothetical protein